MRLQTLSLLALQHSLCSAFAGTSPFFMFSTSDLPISTRSIASSLSITNEVSRTLKQCPSEYYIFVTTSSLHAEDFQQKQAAPAIHKFMTGENKLIMSTASINEVSGNIDVQRWQDDLKQHCGIKIWNGNIGLENGVPQLSDGSQRIFSIELDNESGSTRAEILGDADAMISTYVDLFPIKNFTVFFAITGPSVKMQNSKHEEEFSLDLDGEFQEALHIDLRRDVATHQAKKVGNQTIVEGPLFVKYQFFSPGLFMGFFVGILLLSILYVGVSGLAGLQVSYAAFDKDTGPASQKKQQ